MLDGETKYRWWRDHYVYRGIVDLGRVEHESLGWLAVGHSMAGDIEIAVLPTFELAKVAVERWVEHESGWHKSHE